MKRSFDQLENVPNEELPTKKVVSNPPTEEEGKDDRNDFALENKNRFLWLELSKCKRSLNESRKELEMMRKKTREMESLVSVIQRAWSQLDIDASLLLDGLGDPEVQITSPSAQMLKDFIRSGDQYLYQDPTNLQPLSQIQSDQWSSAEEIQRAADQAIEENLLDLKQTDASANTTEREQSIKCFGEVIEDHLVSHISFTFSLLERLCYALSDGANLRDNLDTLKSLHALKESKAKEAMLLDGIAKLEAELYRTDCNYRISENQKLKTEKQLDRAQYIIKELEEKLNQRRFSNFGDAVKGTDNVTGKSEELEELSRHISLLEKQLAESESAKAEAEMHLTERISKPLMQADAQVSDMRKAMEELRAQCKQRVNYLLGENESLQEKVRDLQLALKEVESASSNKIEDFVKALEKEFNQVKQEKSTLEQRIKQLDDTIGDHTHAKSLLQEYQRLDEVKANKLTVAEEELKSLKEMNQQLSKNLEKARKREKYFESVIIRFAIPVTENSKLSRSISGTPSATSNAASPVRTESQSEPISVTGEESKLKVDTVTQQLVKQSQERCSDVEKELQLFKAQVHDLITEIEAISQNEQSITQQSEQLVKRIEESHSMQQAALEENLKLINALEEAKSTKTEAESKYELMKTVLLERDRILTQFRAEEFNLVGEMNNLRKTLKDLEESRNDSKDSNEELQHKLDDLKVKLQDTAKRNQDLQARCNELSKQCQRERKQRMEEQRKDKKSNLKRESSVTEESISALNQHDNDMLEMTLGMLRCSVCKDRFKSATIKKCFHLFCRECIDENIRSRLRKCPACGEKFGQDDVANIYFTN